MIQSNKSLKALASSPPSLARPSPCSPSESVPLKSSTAGAWPMTTHYTDSTIPSKPAYRPSS